MRHSPSPDVYPDERLKERIRPLLAPCDGVSEPFIGQARLVRIVSEIRAAIIAIDGGDRRCFSNVWIKIGNCLRDESVASGRCERFALFAVTLELALETLHVRLLEFRHDVTVGLVSGLQGTRFARAIGELRFRHAGEPNKVATLDNYVALRTRYDQVRDLLRRINELSAGFEGGSASDHRRLVLDDTAMIVAEKLDRGCDDATLAEALREYSQILTGIERIEESRSLEVIRSVPGFGDLAAPGELFSREEYLSILLQQLASRGASRRSEREGEYEFFRALSAYASKRLNQKKRVVRLAENLSDSELAARMRENGIERLYEEARKTLEVRSAYADIARAMRQTAAGRFVPNRYGIPVQRLNENIYEIYGSRYAEHQVAAVLGNLGYFSMFGLTFVLPTLPQMAQLLRGYFPHIDFSLTTPLSALERAKMLAGFLFVLGVDYPDGTRDVDASDLDRAERVCLDIFEDTSAPSLLERARACGFVDEDDRIVTERFVAYVTQLRERRGLPSKYL
jgi:hypothetical protein